MTFRRNPRARQAHGRLSVGFQALLVALLLTAGCQQQMAMQPSYKPLDPSTFFADGRSARPLVPGTVARGHLKTDIALFTGRLPGRGADYARGAAVVGAALANPLLAGTVTPNSGHFVPEFPFPITEEIIQHGRNRFMIYCVVCHDPLGTGRGKIVERGYTPPPSYHVERLRQVPVGHFFAVITEGYGSMPAYGAQVPPRDRWAIAAYIRALQLSQHFPEDQLPADLREPLRRAGGKSP
jgi:mono/diheme cytochrome c family protein